MLRELPAHRDLLWLLTVREIRVRYARAALGAAWAVFPPLVMMTIFSVLAFGRLIEKGSDYEGVPYTIFALVGLLPWTHFATSIGQATPSLVVSAGMLKKSRFPQEAVPLARILAALLDLGVGLVLLAGLLAWEGRAIALPCVSLPFVLLLQLTFTTGLALLLSAANMFFRDVNYLVQVGLVLAMFATSVVYPIPETEAWAGVILRANPMSAYIDAYRTALILGEWPSLHALLPGLVGAPLALLVGATVFSRCSSRFAEEV